MTKIKYIGAALVTVLALAESAAALSCVRPNVVTSLEDAKKSEKIYQILVGQFSHAAPKPSKPRGLNEGHPPKITPSLFTGYALGSDARNDQRLSRVPVEIETSCLGPWCSSLPKSGRELIAFMELRDGEAPLLRTSVCPWWTFEARTERVEKIRECLDKSCEVAGEPW